MGSLKVKDLIVSLRMYAFWTLLLGILYPLVFTGVAAAVFPNQASGGFVSRGQQLVGAKLIGQKFESERYFWSRPSAVDSNPLPSGGSNLGPTSEALKKLVAERAAKLKAAHGEAPIPQDLLFASASGLDPQISPEAAAYQAARVAKARAMEPTKVLELIEQAKENRQFGILGEPRVNVLALNMSLDEAQGITAAPVLAPTPTSTPAPAPAPESTK